MTTTCTDFSTSTLLVLPSACLLHSVDAPRADDFVLEETATVPADKPGSVNTPLAARFASISSTLDELAKRLPHVELPRFPPVARKLHAELDASSEAEIRSAEACSPRRKYRDQHTLATNDVENEKNVIALESRAGRRRVYKEHAGPRSHTFDMVQGYPDSVSPQYQEYMTWRGIQYFFGGALSVFTTRALLTSVGMQRGAGVSAAAINWVLKDGAGRLGRFLFARWGHQLDCELKQFRLLGDGLMEFGACLELCTILAPSQFLLLACTANLSKNLAAVAASSTRAPIYRTFALRNNMADVTAKGESVANLSDICGVAFGIALSKVQWPIAASFLLLSVGYLIASRQEVDAVVMPFMNQARLAYTMDKLLTEGRVPSVLEGNKREPLLPLGRLWNGYGQVVLGASIEEACESPEHLRHCLAAFPPPSPYVLSYRPDRGRVFILLREHITTATALEACFLSHLWLHRLQEELPRAEARCAPPLPIADTGGSAACGAIEGVGARAVGTLKWAREHHAALWTDFKKRASDQGWRVDATMLALGETRLLALP